jgi:hypothetical protein
MAEYRVKRSWGDNKRGGKVELTNADAKYLLTSGHVAEIQTAEKPAKKAAPSK